MQQINILILSVSGLAIFLIIVLTLSHKFTLSSIKNKTVGNGQHGTARFALKSEIKKKYTHILFNPNRWRKGKNLPKKQGIIVGCKNSNFNKIYNFFISVLIEPIVKLIYLINKTEYIKIKRKSTTKALVDTDDVNVLMLGASGVGKTSFWLYPTIEYCCASGMSMLISDTKGDILRNYGTIAQKYYGYKIAVIDLRNPTCSNGCNFLHLVNKYIDLHKNNPHNITYRAKAEKYSKIIAKTIIMAGSDNSSYGQNAFFYDSAEGLLCSIILIVSEFAKDGERHIVSVFKLIQELLTPSGTVNSKGNNKFKQLINLLPPEHKARWFAGAALNTSEQAMASVMSTALSRLNSFLDSELEQLICFENDISAEKFCNEKTAIFITLPEENPVCYFMVSLIIQQLYREILTIADENGGKMKNKGVFLMDEFGTFPKIESAEMMFSASRSRGLQLVPIIQSFAQLERSYGKESADIIIDNTQVAIFGGFAPNSSSAQTLSKSLGSKTVLSGTVSKGNENASKSLQMIERPLLTSDELKTLSKGEFIVMKTGFYPMKVLLKLYFKWGILFEEPYILKENNTRKVKYTNDVEIIKEVKSKYGKTYITHKNTSPSNATKINTGVNLNE